MTKKKYPRPDKIQVYPGMDIKNKVTKMAREENRSVNEMVSLLLIRATKSISV